MGNVISDKLKYQHDHNGLRLNWIREDTHYIRFRLRWLSLSHSLAVTGS